MALIIAGERSGVGKTTITLALLSYLTKKGYNVQSFKVGPDYIDPMFHSHITGRPCRNLDPVLTSTDYVKSCYQYYSQDADLTLIEGVMGLFDGVPALGPSSTADIGELLDIPVALVINASQISCSVAAITLGYRTLNPNLKLAGVILNQVGSDRHLTLLKEALGDTPILGVIHRRQDVSIPDRHLGLVPRAELGNNNNLENKLADIAEDSFNWDVILPLLSSPQSSTKIELWPDLQPLPEPIKIAIAKDEAFNFYYEDNLDLLTSLGAKLLPFSPMDDEELPSGVQGIYFGGGYPEMFAEFLASNEQLRQQLKYLIQQGLPVYAECGGLMYLCRTINDFGGQAHPMVDIIPAVAEMGKVLTMGYRQIKPCADNFLFPRGSHYQGHEFHRSQLVGINPNPILTTSSWHEGHCNHQGWLIHHVFASYLHLHWGANPDLPRRWLAKAAEFNPIN